MLPPFSACRMFIADNIHDGIDGKPAAKSYRKRLYGSRERQLGKIERFWEKTGNHIDHPADHDPEQHRGRQQGSGQIQEYI